MARPQGMNIEVILPAMDHPINECRLSGKQILAAGGSFWQKWTCEACGVRQTQKEQDVFLPFCECSCGHVTDVEARGCNFRAKLPL